MTTVYTIGHSNTPASTLIDALQAAGIKTLADIRRYPASRRHPQFNAVALAASLGEAGINYQHFEALGGRRSPRAGSPNTALTSDQFRGYADHCESAEFDDAVTRLLSLAEAAPTAVMCAEANPYSCHRLLLADNLTVRGHEVVHLTGKRRRKHELSPIARVEGGHVMYPALL